MEASDEEAEESGDVQEDAEEETPPHSAEDTLRLQDEALLETWPTHNLPVEDFATPVQCTSSIDTTTHVPARPTRERADLRKGPAGGA